MSVFQQLRHWHPFPETIDGKLTLAHGRSIFDWRTGSLCSSTLCTGTLKVLSRLGLLCICAVQMHTWAGPREIQSIDSIRNTVADFLSASVQTSPTTAAHSNASSTITVGKLDARLALDQCQTPLSAFLPAGARLYGKTTVGVRCDGHKPWTVYVPAKIVSIGKYLVAKRSLARGRILVAEDVEYAQQDTSTLPRNHIADIGNVIGMALKHQLSPGRTVTANMLTRPDAIKKGQQVTIYSRSSGLLVSSVGIAMANAAEGARVKVKNPRSRRIIEGIVRADGNVDTGR